MQPGQARCTQETLTEVEKQVKTACLGIAQTVKDLQTNSGGQRCIYTTLVIKHSWAMQKVQPQRPVAQIQDELMAWISMKKAAVYNPFLTLFGKGHLNCMVLYIYLNDFTSTGFDASSDMPVEILHTILLGIMKYVWYLLHSTWKDSHKKIYAEHLQATNTSGLSIYAI
jgi:hypothetical protein